MVHEPFSMYMKTDAYELWAISYFIFLVPKSSEWGQFSTWIILPFWLIFHPTWFFTVSCLLVACGESIIQTNKRPGGNMAGFCSTVGRKKCLFRKNISFRRSLNVRNGFKSDSNCKFWAFRLWLLSTRLLNTTVQNKKVRFCYFGWQVQFFFEKWPFSGRYT